MFHRAFRLQPLFSAPTSAANGISPVDPMSQGAGSQVFAVGEAGHTATRAGKHAYRRARSRHYSQMAVEWRVIAGLRHQVDCPVGYVELCRNLNQAPLVLLDSGSVVGYQLTLRDEQVALWPSQYFLSEKKYHKPPRPAAVPRPPPFPPPPPSSRSRREQPSEPVPVFECPSTRRESGSPLPGLRTKAWPNPVPMLPQKGLTSFMKAQVKAEPREPPLSAFCVSKSRLREPPLSACRASWFCGGGSSRAPAITVDSR